MISDSIDLRSENEISFYESQLINFYKIGKALSSEKDTFKLLDLIISNSIDLTSSDAGTIYLIVEAETGMLSFLSGANRQGKLLKFAITKNLSIHVKLEESLSEITPKSICGYTAITGLPLKINDAYDISSTEEYCHDKHYDLTTGYITKSILSIPMKTHEDKIMGVIQLINKKKPAVGKIDYTQKDQVANITPYNSADELVMTSLAGQAAVALENNLLYRDMENLLQNYREQNKQLAVLSRNVLKAHEEERKRVAREIHDGPAQSVSNLSLETEICKKYLENGDINKSIECLNDLNEHIKDTVKEMRAIIYDLKPSSLDEGLIKALRNHFYGFSVNTGIKVEFSSSIPEINLEYYLISTIYRIVQEAFTNIHKHANAKKIEVNITCEHDMMLLSIIDDGEGFDPSILPVQKHDYSEGGFGLEGMRERIELIKGSMKILSKPGDGTRILLSIPLVGLNDKK